jgi:hypothetical protein
MLESDSSLIAKIIRATTEDPLELLKLQQSAIQKQLLNQELMNKHLYESLFNAGFLTTTKYTTIGQPSASTNFLDSIKQKFNLNSPLSTSTDNSIVSQANNMNPLAAMMPLGDLFKGMNSILSSLFGSEYWMYWLIALAMGKIFNKMDYLFIQIKR